MTMTPAALVMSSLMQANELRSKYGVDVCTVLVVINYTAHGLTFLDNHDWSGTMDPSALAALSHVPPYSGAFGLHHQTTGAATGSVGAMRFATQDPKGNPTEIAFAWSTPHAQSPAPQCLVTSGRYGGPASEDFWDSLHKSLSNSGYSSGGEAPDGNGPALAGTIGIGCSPFCVLIVQEVQPGIAPQGNDSQMVSVYGAIASALGPGQHGSDLPPIVTAVVLINDTPFDLLYDRSEDYSGAMSPINAPPGVVSAGEATFWVHQQTAGTAAGSIGAVLFTYIGGDGLPHQLVLGWSNPYDGSMANTCVVFGETAEWGSGEVGKDLANGSSAASFQPPPGAPTAPITGFIGAGKSPLCVFYVGSGL